MCQVKTTNLSLTVVIVFIITNLPYMVDELLRQEILGSRWCTKAWCGAVEAVIGISIVSNSCLNPFIYLLFNSTSPRAASFVHNCCILTRLERR